MPSPASAAGDGPADSGASQGAGVLSARLFALLPQTQCTRCGYPDCAGYADAMASGDAGANRCAPGGAEGIRRLSEALARCPEPLDPAYGTEAPRVTVVIDEGWCIGCTKCLDACPTDAILGAAKRMHTVIAPHCTGCELCIPVCPVDCIATINESGQRTGWDAWSADQAARALSRYRQRQARVSRTGSIAPAPATDGSPPPDRGAVDTTRGTPAEAGSAPPARPDPAADRKRAIVEAALHRARSLKAP